MARGNVDTREITLHNALEDLRGSSIKQRSEGLRILKAIFARGTRAENLNVLTDKAYHKIFEDLFRVVITEKAALPSANKNTKAKANATGRLQACSEAVREVAQSAASKLKPKTLEAVIEHIIQTIPYSNGEYCGPIALHYLKTLCIVLEQRSNVEHLKHNIWDDIVGFSLQGLVQYLDDNEVDPSGLSRSRTGVRRSPESFLNSANSNGRNNSQDGSLSRQNAEDLLQILSCLVSVPNAPILQRSDAIADTVIRVLSSQGSAVRQLQKIAFSILNAILSATREDRGPLAEAIAREAVPVICRFWQGKSVAKDEMLSSVRDEMLILLFLTHLHMERSVLEDLDGFASTLNDLLEVMRAEYSGRSERDQLQLEDIDMSDLGSAIAEMTPFQMHDFRLRAHNIRAERNWANLQVIGILERLVKISQQRRTLGAELDDDDMDNQPRKRKRTAQASDRLLAALKSDEENVRIAGLQILPFVLQQTQFSGPILTDLLDQLGACALDKRGNIASWALLAIASCTHQIGATKDVSDWIQLWRVGARALTYSTTCRAASAQLHAMLASGVVQYHEVGEDVEAIVTAADTNGPVLLCDSSIHLMMHLLHVRVTEVPGAGLTACSHVTRWILSRWNPAERSFVTQSVTHVSPVHVIDLLRTSLRLPRFALTVPASTICGSVAQAWQLHLISQDVIRYLLLLDDRLPSREQPRCSLCPSHSRANKEQRILDTAHFHTTRKLVLELSDPKLNDLIQNWKKHNEDRSSVKPDTFRRAVDACITLLLLMPHYAEAASQQVLSFQTDLQTLVSELLHFLVDSDARDSKGTQQLFETLLQAIQPYLPACGSDSIAHLDRTPHFQRFLTQVADVFDRRRSNLATSSADNGNELMDLDDDFGTQKSQGRTEGQKIALARSDMALDSGSASFYTTVASRLILLAAMSQRSDPAELIPTSFMDKLLSMANEELLSCRGLLRELLHSDLVIDEGDATRLVQHLGEKILGSDEFDRSEIGLGFCLDVLVGLGSLWVGKPNSLLADSASQLYGWFISRALPKDIASPAVLKGIARLLLLLMRIDDEPGVAPSLPSPRTSLFEILLKGNSSVQFYIGKQLPEIFNFYILAKHDEVFVDLLKKLPSDPERIEGIAFRLFVLAKLGSRWPTLLRRCIYHIFETPDRISDSVGYAARCLSNVSAELNLENSQELFQLFAPQLIFTWLDSEPIEDMSYRIFGFESLKDLATVAREEAAAIMIMRGQDKAVDTLSKILDVGQDELLQTSFTKVLGYAIAHDIQLHSSGSFTKAVSSEMWVKRCLGNDIFSEYKNLHFADVIALLFNTHDQGDAERYFKKQPDFAYAGQIMEEIKSLSSSNVTLPSNQQPFFKVKNLVMAIQRLCNGTIYEPATLFTAPLVVSIARKLLNSIHPALGSLHACSVLRKLRILICLSGEVATKGYPVEMLLHSIRPFITDPECADDAIGILQYLISRGSTYLQEAPSFVAGNALSIFGSLRAFLKSAPASTTQESQYKETMSKAQSFHAWLGNFVNNYNSPALKHQLKPIFRALVQSAFKIGSVGNADIGTPESDLLFRLLEDEKTGGCILSRPSRELAFKMLCSDFRAPASFRGDIFGSDDLAIDYAAVVWKSCIDNSKSKQYLSWAAKVLGRAFAASGHVHKALLQESPLLQIRELGMPLEAEGSSEAYILRLLQTLTLGHDRSTAGLAEAALRIIVTHADHDLLQICHRVLPQTLNVASNWMPFHPPPSDTSQLREVNEAGVDTFAPKAILRPFWVRDQSIILACSVPDDPLLSALVPILQEVPWFADRVFPFLLHLVLLASFHGQHSIKKKLSTAFTAWFGEASAGVEKNLKMMVNSLLYLRTQELPNEKSSADRSQWLDVDYLKAAIAAKNCGLFKTALLFTEQFYFESGPSKSSRRSSAIAHETLEIPNGLLLTIFENIDDPDLYYGVQQNASLSTIQARLDYEKNGLKSLAFRGAQYDSHVRRRAPESALDIQSMVNALDVLSLSGLSHSLLHAQATVEMSPLSLESMFQTARKLEQWDIPVPTSRSSNAVTLYRAFQSVNTAPDYATIVRAIDEGLDRTMASLVREDLSTGALHGSLQTLAALVEMDEVLNSKESEQFEEMVARFRSRQEWMKIGKFEDVNQILSCRATTFSTLSQQSRLHKIINVRSIDTRLVEVQNALLASELTRAHNALQESLSIATFLQDLIPPCRDLGLKVDVAIRLEASNALWDQGELTSSIGMLQALEKEKAASLKNQHISIGRSKLLSQIGSRVSDARMEKPDRILESYLKPALSELKGKIDGIEAGQVYHQFAVFCDQQLQDADGLEDIERLKKLSKMDDDECKQLAKLYHKSVVHDEKEQIRRNLGKAKSWLKIHQEELQRRVTSRDEFLRQSLENYLLSLSASDEHENNALRFTALWLEHSETQLANEAVSKNLALVASRKFAPLMNQLTSRLQDTSVKFQQLLFALVYRTASDHPFHGMYQIYASANTRAASKDETAKLRNAAAVKLSKELGSDEKSASIWNSITLTNKYFNQLAAEKDAQKYRPGRKISLKDCPPAAKLNTTIAKYPIPSPTMHIKLAPDMDYSGVPVMTKFEPVMSIASGLSTPKIITAIANNGEKFRQLVKGGDDDLRQDAIMEQVFEQVSTVLKTNRSTRQRNLSIRTYKVVPLTSTTGIIEFVLNTIPLHEYLMPAHERYHPKDLKGTQCRKEINDVSKESHKSRVEKYRSVTERFRPALRYFFTERFMDPDEWFLKRLAYTRSTAAISILGHVLGLGDRHGHNILLDSQSGEVVHIDLGVAFEMGRVLPIPEVVPFRLTRDIVDGMGITKTEGVFRRCCEFTLEVLRKEVYIIMTILDVLRYDPLYSWSISPARVAKLQEGQIAPEQDAGAAADRAKELINEPDEAHRALTTVSKKLQNTLSVTATVNDLINQAVDEHNLAVLYSGWAAYA